MTVYRAASFGFGRSHQPGFRQLIRSDGMANSIAITALSLRLTPKETKEKDSRQHLRFRSFARNIRTSPITYFFQITDAKGDASIFTPWLSKVANQLLMQKNADNVTLILRSQ